MSSVETPTLKTRPEVSVVVTEPPMPRGPTRGTEPDTGRVPDRRRERRGGIDVGRFLAAAAVVSVHWILDTPADGIQGMFLFAVPYFTVAAVLFSVQHAGGGRTLASITKTRVQRVLAPWVVWSAIYFVVAYVISGWLIGGVAPQVTLGDAVNGFGGRLWFLPFVFCVGVLAACCGFVARATRIGAGVVCAASVALAAAVWAYPAVSADNISRWGYELPVACVAVVFAVGLQRGWLRVPRNALLSLGCLVGFALLLGLQVGLDEAGDGGERRLAQAAGCVLMLCALAMPNTAAPGWMQRLGRHGYGVYVSHMLLILVLDRLTGARESMPGWAMLATAPVVIALSFAGVVVLSKLPYARWLLPSAAGQRARD